MTATRGERLRKRDTGGKLDLTGNTERLQSNLQEMTNIHREWTEVLAWVPQGRRPTGVSELKQTEAAERRGERGWQGQPKGYSEQSVGAWETLTLQERDTKRNERNERS